MINEEIHEATRNSRTRQPEKRHLLLQVFFRERSTDREDSQFLSTRRHFSSLQNKAKGFYFGFLPGKRNVRNGKKVTFYNTRETNRQGRGPKRRQKVTVADVSLNTATLKLSENFPFPRKKKWEGDKTYETIAQKSLPPVRTAGKLGGKCLSKNELDDVAWSEWMKAR